MRDYLPSEMMPAQLLALYALNEKMESAIEHILYNYDKFSPLVKVLIMLITHHYQLQKKIKLNISNDEIQQFIDADHLKLLQLECSLDFSPYIGKADCLIQEIGFPPFTPSLSKNE